jgi:hypothetical protein
VKWHENSFVDRLYVLLLTFLLFLRELRDEPGLSRLLNV